MFGDGRKVNALHSVKIPPTIGTHNLDIETDVVDNDIPLLFSKSSMKRANMKLNFQNDTINIFDENIPLITTNSGHYRIPITKVKQLINNLNRESDMSITLKMTNDKDNQKKKKLYGPFLWMGFNCLKATATSRRQFNFYHSVPRNYWYSFYRSCKGERLSRPWSHPVV